MNDMSPAGLGHNNPPDPIDQITGEYESYRIEAENWTDGTPVENEAQMNAVDALRKKMRACRIELEDGRKSATAPLYDAYKAEQARWEPTITDTKRIEDCLVASVADFKKRLAAEKAAKEKLAREEEARKLAEAQAAAAAARENSADLEAQRMADQAARDAEQARIRAAVAAKDTVKGMRTYDVTEVMDHRALINWIATNRKDDLRSWMEDYAAKNRLNIPGVVETRQEKRAF